MAGDENRGRGERVRFDFVAYDIALESESARSRRRAVPIRLVVLVRYSTYATGLP